VRVPLPESWFIKLKTDGWRLVLAGIVAGGATLSVYWAFLVPIFQAPDEPMHIDYAFSIYSAGRPISARESYHAWTRPRRPGGWSVWHVYTVYLMNYPDLEGMEGNPAAKVPASYMTRGYLDEIDRHAPPEVSGEAGPQQNPPGYSTIYPFGYYTILAAWMTVLRSFSVRLTVLFFGARIFSALLLLFSLLLIYGVARELRLTRRLALVLTAAIGFFPLTSFVSSYIQPDNLCLTMAMLCCYLALLLRRRTDTTRLLMFLGIALGILCVSKYHTYIAVLMPVLAMLIADRLAGRLRPAPLPRILGLVLVPSVLLVCVQLWINWGFIGSAIANPNTVHNEMSEAAAGGMLSLLRFLAEGAGGAFRDFYWTRGSTFNSFWGNFGWLDTPLVIISPAVTNTIRFFIAGASTLIFGLAMTRLGQVAVRLLRMARHGRWRLALSIAFSNPLLNGYFIFTAGLFLLFMLARYSFAPQGRDWFPFILAIFLVGSSYAPKAIRHRRIQKWLSNSVVAGFALYSIIGSYYAIQSVVDRFYAWR
jgi:4-amino-4-deoxy-L-arabinose transferase-like glycosyltransferase